jgi:hypothetical protein
LRWLINVKDLKVAISHTVAAPYLLAALHGSARCAVAAPRTLTDDKLLLTALNTLPTALAVLRPRLARHAAARCSLPTAPAAPRPRLALHAVALIRHVTLTAPHRLALTRLARQWCAVALLRILCHCITHRIVHNNIHVAIEHTAIGARRVVIFRALIDLPPCPAPTTCAFRSWPCPPLLGCALAHSGHIA